MSVVAKRKSGLRKFGKQAAGCNGGSLFCFGCSGVFDLNTNVGIFIMNLSYALHYNKVAHCILNWYVLPKEDKKLRKLLQIPDEESVVCFIACGDLPERFKIVSSPRITAKDIYTIH